MKKEILYITEGVSYIKRGENTITIIKKDETKKVIPIEIIDSIYIYTQLSLTTGLLELLNKYNIPIYFHGYYGNFTGSFFPKEKVTSGAIIVEQVNNFSNNGLFYAKKTMFSAFSNMLKVLKRYQNNLDKNIIYKMKNLRKTIKNIDSIKNLMGIEGNFRQLYYSQLSKCIKNKEFSFEERNKQPPRNPINSLISLLNMSCYNMVNDSIIKSQLSPFISFYHSMNQNRYNLSLDLAEIFKPILVDRLILKLVNNNMIKKSDFKKDKVIGLVKLKEESYKKVMLEWNNTINSYIKVNSLGKKYKWKSIVMFECYKIIKYWGEGIDFDFYILND